MEIGGEAATKWASHGTIWMSKEWAECRMQMEASETEEQRESVQQEQHSVKAALNYAQENEIQIC